MTISKTYQVYFNDTFIGTTKLEYGDPPMGVVHGQFIFAELHKSNYDFIKQLYLNNGINLVSDYEDIKLLSTSHTDLLTIVNGDGNRITGVGGNQIGVMDGEDSDIMVCGIGYPFYEEEFTHHVKEYDERFK